MDGAASPSASTLEDPSGGGAVDLDPLRPAAPAMIVPGEGKKKGEGYLDLLLRVSLQLLRKGHAPQVRHQGLKLMLHLLMFRWDELYVEEWRAGRHCLFVVADPVNPASGTNLTEEGNDGFFVNDDICDKIMDISIQRILKKSAAMSPESLELLSDELSGKNVFIQYRSVLLDLIRFIAYERPMIAASRAVQRISYIIGDASAVTKYSKDLAANESAKLVLQTVVNTIFNDLAKTILDTEFLLPGLYKIFAGLLMQLLSLEWIEAGVVVILQSYLNALCPFLKHFPNAVAMVMTKLIELLSSANSCHDPSKAQYARLQICQCFIYICQAVDASSLPSDIKDLFSAPQITEEDVLAFVASKGLLILWNRSKHRNEGKTLYLNPECQISTECYSCNYLGCSGSPCLALVKQRQQLHADGELQTHVSSLMQVGKSQLINIFDDCGQGNDQVQNTVQSIVSGDFEESSEPVDEGKMGIMGTITSFQENSYLLRVEHNILSEAFATVSSFPWIQDKEHLLADLLNPLNKIWTQSDWKDNYMRNINYVSDLFADDEFRRTVQLLVKSFEEFIRNRIVEPAGDQEGCSLASCTHHMSSYTLPKLMLTLILQILYCIQMLWEEPITCDLSGVKAEDISFILESAKLSTGDEAKMLPNAKTWSLEIQETGYSVIGLCASVEGAFYELLDNSFIINVLMESLRPMGFNHLGKLIQLVFIPLVKYCPYDCWDNWMFKLLEPLFCCCEEILYRSWFTFLHEGRPKCPVLFGNVSGPEEIVNQFERQLLLKFTGSVSDLLGVLASEKLNSGLSHFHCGSKASTKADVQDLKSISSTSIIGYLLFYNCFWMFSMYSMGCLVDYQASEKGLPFCHALVHLAIVTGHERLNQFILNEMLPTIILLLDGDLKSAISKLSCSLNPTSKEDASKNVNRLCQEIFEVYIDNQVIKGECTDGENVSARFKEWLTQELKELHIRAACAVPNDFPEDVVWNWEFNEEFERYLPTYMNMLVEVDAMDDCLEANYLNGEILLEKLKPEFKSRYGINCCAHPYLQTLSQMLRRKRSAVYYQNRTKRISKFLTQLITHKPYIKCNDSYEEDFKGYQEIFESQDDPMPWELTGAIDLFCDSVLFYREPQFHPLIRESHMELLKTLADQFALAEGSALFEPLEPDLDDFMEHLQPYAWMYIQTKKKESGYCSMKEQARLHEEFDIHLASGILDHRMNEFSHSKDDFLCKVAVSDFKGGPFAKLEYDLIKMSFERRAKLVEWEHQLSYYSQCLRSLMENDEMKDGLRSLMDSLNKEGFFIVDSTDWDNKLFSDSIEKFNKVVFPGQCVDTCLVIRGIMDYHKILQLKDVDWRDAFEAVVSNTNYSWKQNLRQFWVSTRHYEHAYYDTLAQPLQKVYLSDGVPKPKYG
ncbi:unnamed protein product [Urochloa humidicola]